jgi:hypothetical protein
MLYQLSYAGPMEERTREASQRQVYQTATLERKP